MFKTSSYRYHRPGSQQKSTWLHCSGTYRCEYYHRRSAQCRSAAPQSGGTGRSRSLPGSTCTWTQEREKRRVTLSWEMPRRSSAVTCLRWFGRLTAAVRRFDGDLQTNCSIAEAAHANINTNKDNVGGLSQLCATP